MKEIASAAAENAMKIEWGDVKNESRGRKSNAATTTSEQPRTKASVKPTSSSNKDMLERERLALEMAEKVSAAGNLIFHNFLTAGKAFMVLGITLMIEAIGT